MVVGSRRGIDRAIATVLARDACSGCGACALLDSGLEMQLSEDGYARPVRIPLTEESQFTARKFRKVCPGVRVSRPEQGSRRRHPAFGAYVEAWQAWAVTSDERYRGSSGGALTALTNWVLASGQAVRVTGAGPGKDPRRSVPVTITTREQALGSAGSRYTPVPAAGNPDVLSPGTAVVGKPCDTAAIRALYKDSDQSDPPLLFSFFCAGTPSAFSTDRLVEQVGLSNDSVPDELWYRGRGWPGEFTVRSGDQSGRLNYGESWGKVLGRTTQWRCKVCVDGTGEHADVAAADYWQSDANGYPLFEEGDGVSALIARTPRGQGVIRAAVAAGILEVQPLDLDNLAQVQPLQVDRRTHLMARLIGSIVAGRMPPRYPGYSWTLFISMLMNLPQSLRVARATRSRVSRVRARENRD